MTLDPSAWNLGRLDQVCAAPHGRGRTRLLLSPLPTLSLPTLEKNRIPSTKVSRGLTRLAAAATAETWGCLDDAILNLDIDLNCVCHIEVSGWTVRIFVLQMIIMKMVDTRDVKEGNGGGLCALRGGG